jgi:hypothetical protein
MNQHIVRIKVSKAIALIAAVILSSGCWGPIVTYSRQAVPAHTQLIEHPSIEKIGVVAGTFKPDSDFKTLLENHDAMPTGVVVGSAGGAVAGAGLGLAAVISSLGACFNPASAATCPSIGAFIAGGTTIGGAVGAAVGKSADKKTEEMAKEAKVKDVAASIEEALQSLHIQQSVQEHIVSYGAANTKLNYLPINSMGPATPEQHPDYASLRKEGIDTVLEVAVTQASLGHDGRFFDPKYGRLALTAHARLIRLSDMQLIHEADYRYVSPPMFHVLLAADDARYFKQAFNEAYKNLSEQIVDQLFLIYEPALERHAKGVSGDCRKSPLKPIDPQGYSERWLCTFLSLCSAGEVQDGGFLGLYDEFSVVHSLQPEFRWESFPTPDELKADISNEFSTLSDVGYEVRIYEATPYDLEYPNNRKRWVVGGLIDNQIVTTPNSRPDQPLKSCGHYFWTFRARFTLNGQPRTTEWAGVYHQSLERCWHLHAPGTPYPPSRLFYPFKTECHSAN